MRHKLFVLLLSVLLFPVISFSQYNQRGLYPGERIDHFAKVAQNGSDADIKSFVEASVRPVGVPSIVANQFRSAVVQAEKEFRAGNHPGVTEQELVEFHNRLATKLNLPTYAMIDKKQLRFMRMGIMQLEPVTMAPTKQSPQDKEISPVLSPVQAAHLESMVIMQKIANPVFQVEPNKWTPDVAKQIQSKESEKRLDKPNTKSTDKIVTSLPNAITQGISKLSITQGMDILKDVNHTFKFHGDKQ
jgi:hypothetical protein